jgi:hypothetical protein
MSPLSFGSNKNNIITAKKIPTSGLVLYLDGGSYSGSGSTWNDISSKGNDGTIFGSTYDSAAFKKGAFDFDGEDDYVSIADSSSLSFSNQLSVSMYISGYPALAENTTDYFSPIMKSSSNSWNDGFGFYYYSGVVSFFINQWDGSQTVSNEIFFTTATRPALYTATYDGSNIKLYGDDSLITQSSYSTAISNSSSPLNIGRGAGADYYWNKTIISTLIYNRALQKNEISDIFNVLDIRTSNLSFPL